MMKILILKVQSDESLAAPLLTVFPPPDEIFGSDLNL